jgi:solute carrier family 25 oxoglutarate transporter 11
LRRIAAEEGVRGLWTGAVPTIFRAMSLNSSQLVSYNEVKEKLMSLTGEKK